MTPNDTLIPTQFSWPAPPYANHALAAPWQDSEACEVEDASGRKSSVLLICLNSADRVALIQTSATSTPMRLRFGRFRSITLKALLKPADVAAADTPVDVPSYRPSVDYHVDLTDGTVARGVTVGHVENDGGLFLFPPADEFGSLRRKFFPREAYKAVRLGALIGKVPADHSAPTQAHADETPHQPAEPPHGKLAENLVVEEIVAPERLLAALDRQAKMPAIKMGEALIALGLITQEQLNLTLEKQTQERTVPLGELLVESGLISRKDLVIALVRKMGYPVVDIKNFPIDTVALRKVPFLFAQRLNALPLLMRNNLMVVAMNDPTQRALLDEMEFAVAGKVVPVLAAGASIAKQLPLAYEKIGLESAPAPSAEDHAAGDDGAAIDDPTHLLRSLEEHGQDDAAPTHEGQLEQSDNSLVRLINSMIIYAYAKGVSDIHVETQPGRGKVRIRFRKDGILAPYMELPHTYRSAMVARLKIMCDLDISERRKAQDGKIDFAKYSPQHKLELRVTTIPTNHGLEDVVMRLLTSAKPIPMEKLGLSDHMFKELQQVVDRPHGMVLCVGPTGAGKTTTLHSVLGYLNTPDKKIWTAEDPIEITQPKLRQVQVNTKIGWTFAMALRSFLRADPDVIMVGEIRDFETAQIAIEASLTGHLVLSTLHTNSTTETVIRLLDMGMDPFNFADALLAVIGQRLVRKLCANCRTVADASDDQVKELLDDYAHVFPAELRPTHKALLADWVARFGKNGRLRHYHAPGCPKCEGAGLRGRVGVHELLVVTPQIRRLIQTNARPEQLLHAAMESGGMRSLRQDGIEKVLAGLTSIDQVRANCS